MAVLSTILLVFFVLVSILLIFFVAIQSEDNTGLGGIFGGSSDSAFGGQTNKVINKITTFLIIAFFVFSVLIGVVNKSSDKFNFSVSVQDVENSSENISTESLSTDSVDVIDSDTDAEDISGETEETL